MIESILGLLLFAPAIMCWLLFTFDMHAVYMR